MSIQNYSWTKHADQRLLERFLISKSGRNSFITQFMTNGGKFIKKQADGNELWQSNEIRLVVNPETQTIITVYHIYEEKEEGYKYDTELIEDLSIELKKLRKRKTRESATFLEVKLNKALDTIKSLKNTHDNIIDNAFSELENDMNSINGSFNSIKRYREETIKLERGNLK